MPGKSFVITSGKGGVGKTTITANLGAALALRDKKVCLIDADIGLRNLDVMLGLENRVIFDLVQLIEGQCRIKQALIKHKKTDKLFIIAASQTRNKEAVKPEQMKDLIQRLKDEEQFDYIFVDCPAGIEQGFRNAIAGADEAIVVTVPEVPAIRDADKVIGLLQAAEFYTPKLIINRLSSELVNRGEMMDKEDIIDILAIDLLGIVPEDEQMIVASSLGEPIVFSDNSKSATAFKWIARRIDGEDLPVEPVPEGTGLLSRFKKLFSRNSRKDGDHV